MSNDAGRPSPEPLVSPLVRSDPDAAWTVTRAGTPVPDGYPEMVDQLRLLLDRIAAAVPPPDLVRETTKLVTELNGRLQTHEVLEHDQVAGQLINLPGRAQLLTPAYTVVELDDVRATGRVRFGRHHLGSNGAVHGGAIPLLFDDLLGRMALTAGRPKSRTAYLHVEYRSITPIDADLWIEAWFEREEGRKRFLRGVLKHNERVCAEANGLFVALRPGQP